ncbi:hypothetical protein F2Q68_00004633 [Brassica cretica]|uniref:Uncharacterized protein n=1 Tax=Brassica cretica TaxID=69181 RepID=A0A8S9J7M9_BRACR|nr:hypothetical protein F2Q68_00004633 [Brassica cretica]
MEGSPYRKSSISWKGGRSLGLVPGFLLAGTWSVPLSGTRGPGSCPEAGGNDTGVNSCLWTNLGQRSHEIMSTHTFQSQGQRSIVALPEKIKAHRECRPGAKRKNIAPYARGRKVIGKADRGARNIREPPCFRRVYPKTFGFQANQFHKLWVSRGRNPQTSMFQKGLPQDLRVPSEPVPQTLGFSILESGCRFFRRSFSSRYPIMAHISKK